MKGHHVKHEDQSYRILMYCGNEHYFALIKKEIRSLLAYLFTFIVPFLKFNVSKIIH